MPVWQRALLNWLTLTVGVLEEGLCEGQQAEDQPPCLHRQGAGRVQRLSESALPSRLQCAFHEKVLAGENSHAKNYAKT